MEHIKRFGEIGISEGYAPVKEHKVPDTYVLVDSYAYRIRETSTGKHSKNANALTGESISEVAKKCIETKYYLKNPDISKLKYLVDQFGEVWFVYNDIARSGQTIHMKICKTVAPEKKEISAEGIRNVDYDPTTNY